MSKTVDQRVVEMRFDNKQFESNVSTTMSTLSKLKQSLNLTGAAKGLEEVNSASKRCDMSVLSNAVENVKARFSALQVIGVTALANITNSAVNAGKRIISALTIDPIKTGFQEYETQINAVQTILANTESKGSTLKDVNAALDELNTYADKTIYNFTEMTRNIGTFTAAGVDLKTSTSAIQGIANLAAVSGSTSQQASTAMYQLSQALAAGTVKLMDWNSVVNAGMGGQVFQDALKKTARAHGIAVDEMIEKNGSFRESLQEGWITSEILTETLGKMTQSGAAEYLSNLTGINQEEIEATQKLVETNKDGSASYDELAQKMADTGKVSKEEAMEILKMADTATNAATKVKTFTQLWDTLKEAAQSGWTQSWEIIVGDFEEAKELLTSISDTVGDMINKSAEARNAVLQGWKDGGGRDDLIASFKNLFEVAMAIVTTIKEAFSEIIPPITAERLVAFTNGLKDFTEKLKLSDEASANLKSTFRGLFAVIHIIGSAFSSVLKVIGALLPGVGSLGGGILSITGAFGEWLVKIDEAITKTGFLSGITEGIVSFIKGVGSGIKNLFSGFAHGFTGFSDILNTIGNTIRNVFIGIWEAIKTVFSFIKDNVSVGDIFAGLIGAGALVSLKKFMSLFDKLKDVLDGGIMGLLFGNKGDDAKESLNIKEKFCDVLDGVHESLQSFTSGIKVSTLVSIAIAIGILSASLKTIAGLKMQDVLKGLMAMGVMFAFLTTSFKSISKTLDTFSATGIVKTGVALMFVAEAVKILSDAMVKLSGLSWNEIAKGLVGVGGALLELSVALKIINKVKVPISTSVAILALATSCKILSDAFKKFGEMSWEEIGRGLVGMGGALLEFTGVLAVMSKVGGFKSLAGSVSLLIAVQALDEISENLNKIGLMQWDEIQRGLTGMGLALGEVSIAVGALGKISGFSSIFASGAILIVSQSLGDIADALKKFGDMQWDEIQRGLTGMGLALGEVAVVVGALGKLTGFSSVFGSSAILIAVQSLGDLADALKKFGEMSWEEIGRGLVGMGGALLEVGTVTGALGAIAGLPALLGGGAILLAVQSLGDLADAFKKFGEMSWEEIGRGLVGMGGALLEVGTVTGALGAIAGLPALLGGGAILLAVQGLGDIADALKKFGEMDWEEIQRGLVGMGGALGEVALGSLLNTLSGFGAGAISEIAGPLGVLADSVKKWSGVSVPENLGHQLSVLSKGIMSFTFGEMGSSALAQAAPAVGIMADSVRKWDGVTVPDNINSQLTGLADGIKNFTFGGLGAGALAQAAPAVGTMADSVQKWSGVSVPENLNDQLSSLAKGIKSFSFTFVGGWSLSSVTGPLGDLADSVKKWNGVSIPSNLGTQLSSLASGLKSFNGIGGISSAASSFGSLAEAASKLSGVNFDSVTSGLTNLTKTASGLASSSSSFSKLGTSIVNGIVTPLQNGKGKITSATKALITAASNSIKSAAPAFNTAGTAIVQNLAKGIQSGSNSVRSAAKSVATSAKSAINSETTGFWNIGYGVAEGFSNGISAGSFMAAAKARAMAQAAVQAAKDELAINSPSKVFRKIGSGIPEGLAQGIVMLGSLVDKSSRTMAENAIDGTKNAISRISDVITSDIDAQPTIRPVLDLSNVKAGANAIGSLIDFNPALDINGISRLTSSRNRYGNNYDIVGAIDKLRKEVGALEKPSYNINGITYGSDSEIANAMETIIRAAVVERRS